ncbi:MAG: thioredoxin family protein [Bacteroidales bacterium]|nr:thioredoxin family protein [Bacteroidales bacterium]
MKIFKQKSLSKAIIAVLIILFSVSGFSQILEPVKWGFSKTKISENEYELVFAAEIENKWHLYSQDIPMSPPATVFTFEETEGFELIGKVTETESIEEYDPNFEMTLKYFAHEAVFKQKVKLLTYSPVTIKGYLEFMCCDDTKCLPPTDVDFEFKFNADKSVVASKTNEIEKTTEFQKSASGVDDKKISVSDVVDNETETSSLWLFFFISFFAGFAAILTPCVFPMIPMTVTFFMKGGESKSKGRFQASIYGLSIIAIYTIAGTVVAITLGANFANWLSTHWLPNVFFFLIFMFFAASFLGMFEITLPSWMVNKSDKQADKGGISGAFFMAFTLVLVSFSCTGPIVGAILVESAGGMVLKPIIGMFGFSLAFAIPFTLFAFFPAWLSGLPKSGGWLNSVKVVLGFIEIALGLKFLSIADQTYHWGILDREVYLAFWIVIFVLMGFYLLGKLKFSHDSDLKFISVPRILLAIVTFTFVVYLIPGMFGAPLKAISGYLPPQQSHDFDLNDIIRENARTISYNGNSKRKKSICEEPKYNDFLHLPHGLHGYFDYEQGMKCARELNKPVFIDFTGHGCVNCREMEANVWSDTRVLQRLNDEFIIIALYVDDKTKLPESDWITSVFDGKVKKTVGKKYADFQISRFKVNAQPYYVLLDNDGKSLVKPRAYDLDVDEFVDFLDSAIEEFRKR